MASYKGHQDIVRVLAEAGADLNLQDNVSIVFTHLQATMVRGMTDSSSFTQ